MAMISVDRINTEKLGNVRNVHDPKTIKELAATIKDVGMLQPLVVVGPNKDKSYDLVFGTRRLAAAKLIGMKMVPVIVKKLAHAMFPFLQLIENIQRDDLDPLEEAEAYKTLKDEHGVGVNEIARKVGRSKGHVSQRLSLLRADEAVQKALADKEITKTDARNITELPVKEQASALKEAKTDVMASAPKAPVKPGEPSEPQETTTSKQRKTSKAIKKAVSSRKGKKPGRSKKSLEKRMKALKKRLVKKFSKGKDGWGEDQTEAFHAVLDFLLAEKVLMVK